MAGGIRLQVKVTGSGTKRKSRMHTIVANMALAQKDTKKVVGYAIGWDSETRYDRDKTESADWFVGSGKNKTAKRPSKAKRTILVGKVAGFVHSGFEAKGKIGGVSVNGIHIPARPFMKVANRKATRDMSAIARHRLSLAPVERKYLRKSDFGFIARIHRERIKQQLKNGNAYAPNSEAWRKRKEFSSKPLIDTSRMWKTVNFRVLRWKDMRRLYFS